MSVWSDLKDGIRQIILLESRIDQLNGPSIAWLTRVLIMKSDSFELRP